MKRVLAWGAAAALALSTVSVAFARFPDIKANVNLARVHSETGAVATTGGNTQGDLVSVNKAHGVVAVAGSKGANRTMNTGYAEADADSLNIVNKGGYDRCSSCFDIDVDVNAAKVHSETLAAADTGNNFQGTSVSVTKANHVLAGAVAWEGSETMNTGSAKAEADSTNIVNASGWHWRGR